MIVLDTNVISELMRPQPDPTVLRWVAAQPTATLCTTSVNKAEILYALAVLPGGRRRAALLAAAEAVFSEDLQVLPFDDAAAVRYAEIVADRNRVGRRIEAFDALIAATALAAGADLATRDAGGFEGIGLALIDPWARRV
jgi:predicted nucleic acid-binding protein